MRTLSLSASVTAKLTAGGAGQVQLGPSHAGEVWYPTAVSATMTGSTPTGIATLQVFAGPAPTPPNFVDGTYSVLQAASSLIEGQVLQPGQNVFAVWAGGNPNATVTFVVSGTRTVP
jgi:hypothetical protein